MLTRKRRKDAAAVGPSLWDATGSGGEGSGGRSAAKPPRPPGLSLVHSNSLKENAPVGSFVLRRAVGGSVVQLSRVLGKRPPRREVKRGTIKKLTNAAGLRLIRSMRSLDQSKVEEASFVTNTLPLGEFPTSAIIKFLKDYRQRFERRWPGHSAYWAKELTEKGTPHLHLVIAWVKGAPVPSRSEFIDWNDNAWADVVKSTNPHHRRVACKVEKVRTWEGASTYLGGYLKQGQEDERLAEMGKRWGIIGKKNLPIETVESVEDRPVGQRMIRTLRRRRERQFIWLHSKQTHTLEKNRGKPVQWVRPPKKLPRSFLGYEVESVADYLQALRGNEFKVKRIRPRCVRTEVLNVWASDADTGKLEKYSDVPTKPAGERWSREEIRAIKAAGGEVYSAAASWHFLSDKEVQRLLAWARGEASGAVLTSCERRWLRLGIMPMT